MVNAIQFQLDFFQLTILCEFLYRLVKIDDQL